MHERGYRTTHESALSDPRTCVETSNSFLVVTGMIGTDYLAGRGGEVKCPCANAISAPEGPAEAFDAHTIDSGT